MVAVVGLAVLFRRGIRGWRVALLHTVPLGVVYLVWMLLAPKGQDAGKYRTQSLSQLSKFVGIGVQAAFARLGHLPGVGFALGLVLVGGLFVLFRGRGWHAPLGKLSVVLALLAGGLVFLLVTGALRSGQGALLALVNHSGPERARDSRYVYIVAAMLLPALALAADALIRFKWQFAIPIVAVLVVGLPGNIHELMTPTAYFANSHATKAEILAIPTWPNAGQLSGSQRLLPIEGGRFAAEGLTYGWLVDQARAGKFPDPLPIDPTLARDRDPAVVPRAEGAHDSREVRASRRVDRASPRAAGLDHAAGRRRLHPVRARRPCPIGDPALQDRLVRRVGRTDACPDQRRTRCHALPVTAGERPVAVDDVFDARSCRSAHAACSSRCRSSSCRSTCSRRAASR